MENQTTTIKVKPKVKLSGKDSNIFNLLGICTLALKNAGLRDEAKELTNKVFASGSFDEALALMTEYCDVN